jgi:hypothetical protein
MLLLLLQLRLQMRAGIQCQSHVLDVIYQSDVINSNSSSSSSSSYTLRTSSHINGAAVIIIETFIRLFFTYLK